MCLVFCGDYIIPYIGSVLLFYFGFSIKKGSMSIVGVETKQEMIDRVGEKRSDTIFMYGRTESFS